MNEERDNGENGECQHLYWNIDRTNFGVCCFCQEERQFSENGNAWNVVRPGVPRRPTTKDNSLIHAYYTDNREAILRDFFELGLPAMLIRWKISKGTWPGLKKEWTGKGLFFEKAVAPDGAEKTFTKMENERTPLKEAVLVVVSVTLPPFPEMKDDWPESLKQKWFESLNLILKTGKEPDAK